MEDNYKDNSHPYAIPGAIVIAGLLVAGAVLNGQSPKDNNRVSPVAVSAPLPQSVKQDIPVTISWNGLGAKLLATGVIDKEKFLTLYTGADRASAKAVLDLNTKSIEMNAQNAPIILNLLWAMGLGQKSAILDTGAMKNLTYGGAENFASTGGWTIAVGKAMDHYSMHNFVALTPEQETLVKSVTENIYRPCCDNPTYFPDCNHGMAMLGLMELLASQGANEKQLYATALQANSYWFPGQYETIASYLQSKSVAWNRVNPEDVLGKNFSSSSGYKTILAAGETSRPSGGSGCSV